MNDFDFHVMRLKLVWQTRSILRRYAVRRWAVTPISETELRALWGDR